MTTKDTKARLIDAALEVIKRDGYAGTSARSIARAGDLNQALIFYHFGSVNGLLLAALDRTSEERMGRYRDQVGDARSLDALLDVAFRVYREDLEAGHMTVVSEMVAASMADEALKREVLARIEPWVSFVEETVGAALEGSPFAGALPARTVAYGLVAFYLGVNLLANLDPEADEIGELFATARGLSPVAGAMLQLGD